MEQKKNKTLWSGRFKTDLNPLVQKYTRSLHLDRRLALLDIRGSRAHVHMLAAQGIISGHDEKLILGGLSQIEEEINSEQFTYHEELEDIHMNIENRLQEIIGESGNRIHAGRSRNDQIALDLKLFCLETSIRWRGLIVEVQRAFVGRAQELRQDMLPGWTHLQAAQPLSWGHYLLAFCEMLSRDFHRLSSYEKLHSYSPLGAGALIGTTLPLDPEYTAKELGFLSSFDNSYDVVGDRDFILEILQIATQLMLHISRLAEDFIYMSSTPVSWIELPDALCTGSSMMPQKKNPDILELARGKTASVLGHNAAMGALIKGIPTSYHRDLQQDKEHLFSVVDAVDETLSILPLVILQFEVQRERIQQSLERGFLLSTDLAEYLVSRGTPFRIAHRQVGKLVSHCLDKNVGMNTLSLGTIQKFAPSAGPEVHEVLQIEGCLRRRQYKGSSGLVVIDQKIKQWNDWIMDKRKEL